MELLLFILFALLLASICWYITRKRKKEQADLPSLAQGSDRLITIVIDSLMDQPLQKAIKDGNAPALKFLMEKGQYFPNVVSAYPTMSMTIDTTLLTGTYPDQHRIPGLVWYDTKSNRLISYGSARKEIMMLGVKNVLNNALDELNNKHISSEVATIHEELDRENYKSASINALVYRGSESRQLIPPKLLTTFNFTPPVIHTKGTSLFSFGALSQLNPHNRFSHFWQSFGFNDKFSVDELIYLMKQHSLPKFTIAYLPNNDKSVHKKGPGNINGIKKADHELQRILDTFELWEEALRSSKWVIMGDSGHAPIGNQPENLIDLPSLLQEYRIPKLASHVKKDAQIVLGLNERMAYVYVLDPSIQSASVVDKLKKDERIGFVAWREGEEIKAASSEQPKTLSFRKGQKYKDTYEQMWDMEGEPGVLDVTINDKQQLEYGKYPDPFSRLMAAFYSHDGDFLIVDAKPGYEFAVEGSPTHKGGASHGSLHEADSLIPMIVTGTDTRPVYMRIVDLKKWFIQLLSS
ncbi:alkaline phosphatase family protein [Halobacillus sp. Marseille-P3879]|uniref:alkaline phosphatase family protein n=1 Tax=Halobacillus sp. Marseille-P3879 TaxID=2045014 RepID=UPI000C7B7241|nr:alkaline phosphatase family protein [Halobacillus sp. Marseille-P3879]